MTEQGGDEGGEKSESAGKRFAVHDAIGIAKNGGTLAAITFIPLCHHAPQSLFLRLLTLSHPTYYIHSPSCIAATFYFSNYIFLFSLSFSLVRPLFPISLLLILPTYITKYEATPFRHAALLLHKCHATRYDLALETIRKNPVNCRVCFNQWQYLTQLYTFSLLPPLHYIYERLPSLYTRIIQMTHILYDPFLNIFHHVLFSIFTFVMLNLCLYIFFYFTFLSVNEFSSILIISRVI